MNIIKVTVEGAEKPLFVSIRPNLMKFLQQLTRYYTLVIYTAGTKEVNLIATAVFLIRNSLI